MRSRLAQHVPVQHVLMQHVPVQLIPVQLILVQHVPCNASCALAALAAQPQSLCAPCFDQFTQA